MLTPGHPGRPVIWPYDDDRAEHYGLVAGGRLVGCLSLCPGALPGFPAERAYRFHSMAVEQAEQGRGLGRRLLAEVAQILVGRDADLLFGTARPSALGFYRRCGFVVGGAYQVEQ